MKNNRNANGCEDVVFIDGSGNVKITTINVMEVMDVGLPFEWDGTIKMVNLCSIGCPTF